MLRRRDEAYVPCSALMADGVFRGLLMGALWGAVTDLDFAEGLITTYSSSNTVQAEAAPYLVRRVKAIGRSSTNFGLFIGGYAGGCCFAERLTGFPRDHWVSAMFGGFLGGSIFGLRSRNPTYILTIGATASAFASLVRYLQD